MSLLLLAAAHPARAQYGPPSANSWGEPTLTGDGTVHSVETYQGIFNDESRPWGDLQHGPGELVEGVISDSGYPAHADTSGTMTMTRTWTGPDAPPKTVYILETSDAFGAGGVEGAVPGTATAQDAFGDPMVPSFGGGAQTSSGSKLIQMDSSSGTITLSGTISASSDIIPLPNGEFQGRCLADVDFYWNFDSRAVMISANVDVTNMKSPAYNPDGSVEFDAYNNIVFAAVPHTPMLDGTMYGDYGIGYGSSYIPGDPDPDDMYPVKYTAHLAGTWGADSTYNWYSSLKSSGGDGPTFTNVYIGAAALPTDAGPPLINPGETGKVDHIHLTVTDSNGGAQGTANYYMALHQPDEFLPSNQAPETIFKKQDEVEASAPGWATPSVGVNCTWNAPGAYWDYLAGGADVMAEIPGVDEALPWFGAFCAAAGVAVDHLKPLPCTGPASFDPQEPGSDYPDEALYPFSTTDHRDFVMIPHFWDMYTRTHLLQDVWNTRGFVGETPINSDVFVRQAGCYGTYKYQVTAAAVK